MDKNKFKFFDILGSEITFTVDGNRKFKSVFGAFLSFVLIILFLILFSLYFYDYFQKQRPSNSFSKQIIDSSNVIEGKDFFFFTGIGGPSSKVIENLDKKFFFTLRFFYFNQTINDYKNIKINLTPCALSERFKAKKHQFNSLLYLTEKSYFCLPDNYDFMDIQGFNSTNASSWYVLNLFTCNENLSANKTCVSNKELEEEIPHYSLQYVYLDSLVDIDDYKQPLKYFYKSYFSPGTLESMTQEDLQFSKIFMKTDDSFVFSNENVEESFTLKNREKNIYPSKGYQYKHKLIISIGDLHDVYFRSYLKILNIFAIVYSNIKILILIFLFLNRHLSSYDVVDYIFSFLYKYNHMDKNPKLNFSAIYANLLNKNNYDNTYDNSRQENTNLNEKQKFNKINNKDKIIEITKNNNVKKNKSRINQICANKNTENLLTDKDYHHKNEKSFILGFENFSHLKYFHNIKEKIPKVKNMNKFFIARICCCKNVRNKREIYKKMVLEVNDHMEIFNYITISLILNNYLTSSEKLNKTLSFINNNKNIEIPNESIRNKNLDDEDDHIYFASVRKNNTISDSLFSNALKDEIETKSI